TRGERGLEVLIEPISGFLVPIFFVVMGMRTDLAALARPSSIALALALTAAAVVGKQACALATGRGVDRLTVGIGMMPRGEVSLIFASIGQRATIDGAPLVDERAFSAIVAVVLLTTMI